MHYGYPSTPQHQVYEPRSCFERRHSGGTIAGECLTPITLRCLIDGHRLHGRVSEWCLHQVSYSQQCKANSNTTTATRNSSEQLEAEVEAQAIRFSKSTASACRE